jgi:hypothetical protein
MKSSAVSPARDAYGQELWNCHQGKTTYEIVERDDGFLDPGSALPYFADYPSGRRTNAKPSCAPADPPSISVAARDAWLSTSSSRVMRSSPSTTRR